jgi:hypothetical protein
VPRAEPGMDIALPGHVDEEEAAGHQGYRQRKCGRQRFVQNNVTGRDAKSGVRNVNTDSLAAE